MKKLVFVLVSLVIFSACQNKPLLNSELGAMYESTPTQEPGFGSSEYSVTDYRGEKKIDLPIVNKGSIFISNVSGQENKFFKPRGGLKGKGIEMSYLDDNTVRVCYKDKPFFQKSSTLLCDGSFSPLIFSMREYEINENSFVFISEPYDFQGEIGGMYCNGNIIAQRIMVKGGVPFIPVSIKKVGKNIIVHFESANSARLYALLNQKTRQLTLPDDYEYIKNDYTVASERFD